MKTSFKIDPAHSSAHFIVRHMMITNVRGGFTSVQGTVVYDSENHSASSIDVVIDVNSLNTSDPEPRYASEKPGISRCGEISHHHLQEQDDHQGGRWGTARERGPDHSWGDERGDAACGRADRGTKRPMGQYENRRIRLPPRSNGASSACHGMRRWRPADFCSATISKSNWMFL